MGGISKKIIKKLMLFFLIFSVGALFLKGSEEQETKNYDIKLKPVFNILPTDDPGKGFFVFPVDFKVSRKGKIFFIDSKTGKVLKYSEKGKFEKYIGRKGQGPGEYIAPQKLFLSESKLYVYDGLSRKIHIYKLTGEYIRTLDIGKIVALFSDFYVDKNNNVYALWIDYSGEEIRYVVGKFDFKKRNIEKIKILKREKIKKAVMGGISHEYSQRLFFRIFPGGFVYGDNMDRTIYFYNIKNGVSEKILLIKWKREKISQREVAFLKKMIGKEEAKKLPEYKPFYQNLFVDENEYIYFAKPSDVLTPRKNKINRIIAYNKNGKHLFDFKLPAGYRPLTISKEGIYVLVSKDDDFCIEKFVFEQNQKINKDR